MTRTHLSSRFSRLPFSLKIPAEQQNVKLQLFGPIIHAAEQIMARRQAPRLPGMPEQRRSRRGNQREKQKGDRQISFTRRSHDHGKGAGRLG